MLIERAQWYIESFLGEPLTLEKIAKDCGVSTFHLTRTFNVLTGMPVMRYVWRRRLARAAEALVGPAQSVLSVALDAGYQSHEAFSRAFKAEFGLTPNQAKSRGVATERLTKPSFMWSKTMPKTLNPPVVEAMPERLMAGPSRRYNMETRTGIPAQWVAYDQDGSTPANMIPEKWYGVISGFNEAGDTFDYLCGVEVSKRGAVPAGQTLTTVPAGRYARFATNRHISQMGEMWGEIYAEWLGRDGLTARPGPSIEYYPVEFDGRTGEGGYEIWIAVE